MHTFRHGSKIPMGFFQQFRYKHGLAAAEGPTTKMLDGVRNMIVILECGGLFYTLKKHAKNIGQITCFFIVTSPCLTIERGHDSLGETV